MPPTDPPPSAAPGPRAPERPRGTVVDLYCGIGGMSMGFRDAGFRLAAGYDQDASCADAYESLQRPGEPYVERPLFRAADIPATDPRSIAGHWRGALDRDPGLRVLIACCPCQTYSTLAQLARGRAARPRASADAPLVGVPRDAVEAFALQVRAIGADLVVMENVPALRHHRGGASYGRLVEALEAAGYRVTVHELDAYHYGVPQRRQRLITTAAREAWIPPPRREPPPVTLRPLYSHWRRDIQTAIGDLWRIEPGAPAPAHDDLHVAASVGPLSMRRIKATPEGGGAADWPPQLRLPRTPGRSEDPYRHCFGRCRRDGPAKTITTAFVRPSATGWYVHPWQDRGYSLREGLRLQGFPDDFRPVPRGVAPDLGREARHVGNAVPPPLARAIAEECGRALGV